MKANSRVISFPLFLLIAIPSVGQTKPALAAQTEGSCQLGSRTVAGAPYTGMQETVHTQTLADGTRIERKGQRSQFYRDSQGRERQEIYLQIGLPGVQDEFQSNIMIRDPVECVVYNLHPTKHIAERRAYSSLGASQAGLVNKGTQSGAEQPRRTIPEELRPKSSTEDLGTDTIEGLAVQGTRITTTFPAGSQGNDRPIVVTHESWMSQELRISVLEKISDPRSGETIRRLTNIGLTEPSADVFRVPADYQIRDEHE
jgi:hypothetical protein